MTGAAHGNLSHPAATGQRIDLVLLDVGGPIYDDVVYRDALLRATRELATGEVDEARFQAVYDDHRQQQRGSLRSKIAETFLSSAGRPVLSELAKTYWDYPSSALYPDVLPTLQQLHRHYRTAIVANQRSLVFTALQRDGIADHIDVWALSESVGAEKPHPAIFQHALNEAGTEPTHAVHVGNRLDTDVRGAQRLGLRTVWVLRGEAPLYPTREQFAEPDAAVSTLAEVPTTLGQLQGVA